MSSVTRWSHRYWIFVLLGAIGFAAWIHTVRVGHIVEISKSAGGAELRTDPASVTGYADGVRRLVVPAPNFESARTIVQAQSLLDSGEWRVRVSRDENAPHGIEERSSSVVRWWLGVTAAGQALVGGIPSGVAVERAALVAEPLVHVLLVIATTLLVVRRWGGAAAASTAIGLVGFFPVGAAFAAGLPSREPFVVAAALWSVLGVAIGLSGRAYPESGDDPTRWKRGGFVLGGVAGGAGLWVDATVQVWVLAGLVLGRWAARWAAREPDRVTTEEGQCWRVWSYAGATTIVVSWLLEYGPDRLDFIGGRHGEIHPWYAVAWLGAGELAARLGRPSAGKPSRLAWSTMFAGAAVFAPLVAAVARAETFASVFTFPGRPISRLSAHGEVTNLAQWFSSPTKEWLLLAALVPLLLFVLVWFAIVRARRDGRRTDALVVASMPAVLVAVSAFFDFGLWAVCGALVLVATICAVRVESGKRSRVWFAGVGSVAAVGALVLVQTRSGVGEDGAVNVDPLELRSLVDRDLAHWLARRSADPDAVVLGPPALTAALTYYGGFRGLGTPNDANEAGFQAAMRIAAATSSDEARALVESRRVAFVVHPTWEPFLDEYARLGTAQPEASLMALLNNWLPPRWLRPVAYRLPDVPEFRDEFVAVYEVVDVQDNATALSRLAEYFAEVGWLDHAERVAGALEEAFPGEVTAQTARAQVAAARRDGPAFGRALARLEDIQSESGEGWLEWDRRVALAVVWAQGNRAARAKAQLERCLEEMDAAALRSLAPGMLHRFMVLLDRHELAIEDAELRRSAAKLAPEATIPARSH
ncbi:hypothetical protein ASA1KI_35130 [Opitutales bacterium ASA1]|uniref:hypothetical protein n=1 Tax=Congregicoccus parvus TaxID=3081749 RepID=UPI002B2A7377|nr:hypothetical protein ASA1KI_35130 [Opitutales bacterium ASA1]